MPRSRWAALRRALAGTLGVAFGTGLVSITLVPAAHGQEPLPKLPPTTVEGSVTPGQPAPNFEPTPPFPGDFPPQPGSGAPISSGGIFASPPADGYRGGSQTTGAGIDVPQLNFPGTVNVVPQATLRDQQVLRVQDVLRDISAANNLGDFRRPDAFLLRGFEVEARDYRKNGFRDPTQAPRDFINVQRVEVLKGPASILYGSGQPAGVVNIITKKPLAEAGGFADVQFGTFGLIRPTVDATGPLDDEGRFLYRITSAYEHNTGFRDFYFNERTFVCPSFTWVMDADTSFNIEFEYLNDRRRFDTGVAAVNNVVNSLPITRYLGEPGDFARAEDFHLTMWFVHRFTDDCYFRIGGFGEWNRQSFADTSVGFAGGFPSSFGPLAPAILDPATFGPLASSTLIRQREDTPEFDNSYYSLIADFACTVQTGPVEHKALIGTELARFHDVFNGDSSALFNSAFFGPFPVFFPVAPLDPFNPNYNQPAPPLVNSPSLISDIQQQLYGFYAQDLMNLNNRWQLLAGVRYDVVKTQFNRAAQFRLDTLLADPSQSILPSLGFPLVSTDTSTYRLTPRVGLVYQPIENVLSFYGSYSQSFDALTGFFSRSPEPLKPEVGEAWEGGLKADLLDGQLSVSVAGFHITKQNVAVLDQGSLTTTQIGLQRSQGAEVTAVGRLTDRWSIIANYSYVDARIIEDNNPLFVGKQFRNVPYNTANLWTRYNLIDSPEQTFGLAAGMVFVDNRPGDLASTFVLPGYTRWDGGVFYNRGLLRAALYLENIFDRQYYTGSVSNVSIFPGAPITARASLGVQF